MSITNGTRRKPTQQPTLEERISLHRRYARDHLMKMLAFAGFIVANYFLVIKKPLGSLMASKGSIGDWAGSLDNTGEYWGLIVGLIGSCILFGLMVYQATTTIGATVERRRLETVKMTRDSVEQLLIEKGVIR